MVLLSLGICGHHCTDPVQVQRILTQIWFSHNHRISVYISPTLRYWILIGGCSTTSRRIRIAVTNTKVKSSQQAKLHQQSLVFNFWQFQHFLTFLTSYLSSQDNFDHYTNFITKKLSSLDKFYHWITVIIT